MTRDEEIGFEVGGRFYAVRRHPKAPMFDNPNDASLIIKQLIGELTSKPENASRPQAADPHHMSAKQTSPPLHGLSGPQAPRLSLAGDSPDDAVRAASAAALSPSGVLSAGAKPQSASLLDAIKQASLVNLFFFLKYVAAASGPYDFLNDGVHLDLANFRQSDECMAPGASAAIFLSRGFAKSTIANHGAVAWELLRNPDLRVKIVNSVITRAHEFKNTAQRIFDSNPLVKLLWPECVPGRDHKRWTNNEFVMPNAQRFFREPSCGAGGSTGASEGDHVDLLSLDDLIGMDDVDKDYNANQKMGAVQSWMSVNMTALLVSPMTSRRVLVATRYGRGDVYQGIWDDCKKLVGYREGAPNVVEDKGNTWTIYYRHPVERGVAINPFVITKERYEKLLKDEPFVAAYQYANNVDIGVNNEFGQYKTGRCRLEKDDVSGDWLIRRLGEDVANEDATIALSDCSVCVSVDWAGSKKNVSVNTSRTSIGLWARDWKNRVYRLKQKVGYMGVPEAFDAIFELVGEFGGYLKGVLVEANAMQVGVVQLFDLEMERRGKWFFREIVNARGDKEVRIRTVLSNPLGQGKVYLAEGASTEFREEMLSFPSKKLDVLDESAKAIAWLSTPASSEKMNKIRRDREYRQAQVSDNIMGY